MVKPDKPAFVVTYQCCNCTYAFAHIYNYGVTVYEREGPTVEIVPMGDTGQDDLECEKCGHRGIEIIDRSPIEE